MKYEHFLIKNAKELPKDLQINSYDTIPSKRLSYITKTYAAPGDDDDFQGIKEVWYPWESVFY